MMERVTRVRQVNLKILTRPGRSCPPPHQSIMARREVEPGVSVAGIVENPDTQSRVIPESRRADGR
jgi:hypothetical protein